MRCEHDLVGIPLTWETLHSACLWYAWLSQPYDFESMFNEVICCPCEENEKNLGKTYEGGIRAVR